MNRIKNVLIGADPEVFFVERKTNLPRSAEGLLGGTKDKPVPMQGLPEGFFVQEDNVTAEFNIPPAHTAAEFTKSIFESLKYIKGIAKKNNLKLAFVPDLDFPEEQLATKHCQTLGCDPDFNIWAQQENPRPKAPELMRTAAGHIHIGWDSPDWDGITLMAKMFDLFVTVPSILVTEPNRRRQLYGKAGACRPKKYGVECRSLDNFWLGKQSWQNTVYMNTLFAVDCINRTPQLFAEVVDDYGALIIDSINNHNRDYANLLVEKFQIPRFAE